MLFPSNSSTPSHLSPIRQLQALHLLRIREKAGLSRAQMARQTDFSPQDIENVERGVCVLDIVEIDAWCRAAGTSLTEFAHELEVEITAEEAKQDRTKSSVLESGDSGSSTIKSNATNIQLLYFYTTALLYVRCFAQTSDG